MRTMDTNTQHCYSSTHTSYYIPNMYVCNVQVHVHFYNLYRTYTFTIIKVSRRSLGHSDLIKIKGLKKR